MKKCLTCLAIACAGFAADTLLDLTQFKNLAKAEKQYVLVENFDRDVKDWQLSPGYKIVPNEGHSGTSCLMYERTDPKEYSTAILPVKMNPFYSYKLSVTYRTELQETKPPVRMEIFAIRNRKGNKSLPGNFKIETLQNAKDWTTMSMFFRIPPETDNSAVQLLLRTARLGKIWYDNIVLESMDMAVTQFFPIWPKELKLEEDGKVSFFINTADKYRNLAILADVGGRKQLLQVKDKRATGLFGKFPPGEVAVNAQLLDMDGKAILATDESKLYSWKPSVKPPPNVVTFKSNNKTLLNGKPYLPVGIFVGFFNTPNAEEDVKRISDAGFNSILSLGLQFRCAGDKPTKRETLLSSLDMLDKYGLKYIFSIKYQMPHCKHKVKKYDDIVGLDNVTYHAIENVISHPAMLAYYISDENPLDELPAIRQLRTKISSRDPFHPTLTLTDVPENAVDFSATGDALMVDPYPIGYAGKQAPEQSMAHCRNFLKKAKATGAPVWYVPQIFAWASNRPPQTIRFPTELEMRSMLLEGAVQGADAYIMYSYHYTFAYAERKEPGSALKFWPSVVPCVKLIRELEPWLLSDAKPPVVHAKTLTGKEVAARAFTLNAGKTKVVITAIGPGHAAAEISVPGLNNLKSRFGNTKNLGNGKYLFTGLHVDSDILE